MTRNHRDEVRDELAADDAYDRLPRTVFTASGAMANSVVMTCRPVRMEPLPPRPRFRREDFDGA